ncbi:MAG: glycosyltransferase family 39 protein [Oscillochloridaceae bacterium umkhey_bin13]
MNMLATKQDHRSRSWLLIMALLGLAGFGWWLRAPMHAMPLERDEGAYAIIGARLLAGDVLYRDLFDHKPPLAHLVFALAAISPGDPVVAVRVLATVYLLGTTLLTFLLARQIYGTLAGLSAAALLIAYGSSRSFQGLTFNTEAVLILPAMLGCLMAVRAIIHHWPAMLGLAGGAVGLAVLAKPVALALVGPLFLVPLLARWPRRVAVTALGLALLGLSLPLLLLLLTLLIISGLAAAPEALWAYNRLYAAEGWALGWSPRWLWRIWEPMLALGVPALVGLLIASLPGGHILARGRVPPARWWPAHATVALWGLALLATALLSLRSFPHYYLAAVPWFSLWVGAGVARLAQWLTAPTGQTWPATILVLLASVALVLPALAESRPLRGLSPTEQISYLYDWDGPEFFAPAAEVATFIAAHVPPTKQFSSGRPSHNSIIWLIVAPPAVSSTITRLIACRTLATNCSIPWLPHLHA